VYVAVEEHGVGFHGGGSPDEVVRGICIVV